MTKATYSGLLCLFLQLLSLCLQLAVFPLGTFQCLFCIQQVLLKPLDICIMFSHQLRNFFFMLCLKIFVLMLAALNLLFLVEGKTVKHSSSSTGTIFLHSFSAFKIVLTMSAK